MNNEDNTNDQPIEPPYYQDTSTLRDDPNEQEWLLSDLAATSDPDPVKEPWLSAYPGTRAWAYRILAALLVIAAGWAGWEAVTASEWLNLGIAVLNISGTVGFIAAEQNVQR